MILKYNHDIFCESKNDQEKMVEETDTTDNKHTDKINDVKFSLYSEEIQFNDKTSQIFYLKNFCLDDLNIYLLENKVNGELGIIHLNRANSLEGFTNRSNVNIQVFKNQKRKFSNDTICSEVKHSENLGDMQNELDDKGKEPGFQKDDESEAFCFEKIVCSTSSRICLLINFDKGIWCLDGTDFSNIKMYPIIETQVY